MVVLGVFMSFHLVWGIIVSSWLFISRWVVFFAASPGVACRVAGCLALAEDLAAAVDRDRPGGWGPIWTTGGFGGKDRYPTNGSNGQHATEIHRIRMNKGFFAQMKSFGGLKIKEIGLSYLDFDILIWVFWRRFVWRQSFLSNQLRTPSVRWLLCFDFESSPFQRDVKDCWTGIGRGPIFFRRFSDVFGFSHQLGWSRVSPSPSTDGLLMVPWKVDSGRIWLVRLESAGGTDKSLITLEMLFTLGYLSWSWIIWWVQSSALAEQMVADVLSDMIVML